MTTTRDITPQAAIGSRARLYRTVRSAHLERARDLAPATILYRSARYDFDESLTEGLSLMRVGPVRAAWLLARSDVRQLEVTEPLMLSNTVGTALAIAALRARVLLGGARVQIVSYLIENANPLARPVRLRRLPRRVLDAALARFVWRNLDRLVWGTDAARETYETVWGFPARGTESTLIPALPAPCACAEADDMPGGPGLLYLGAFTGRKGLPQLLMAWPLVAARVPGATLTIVGKGELEALAWAAAADRTDIEVVIDPSRTEIHRRLRRAAVLALPSQPTPAWREQVGLPLVEALAHGCAVVTTTETGLADWLSQHGHRVLEPDCSPAALAEAIAAALVAVRAAPSVTAQLPDRDGRLVADDWLFGAPTDLRR